MRREQQDAVRAANRILPASDSAALSTIPMTSWSTGFCAAGGIELHYRRTGGSGPPLVLLHGLTGSGACWTPLARALEGDYDVLMPDARGHGQSGAPPHGHRYEDHAGDVAGLIRGLGLAAPVLLGHSMGGMTAALVASQGNTDIRALILADPTFLSPQRQREVCDSDIMEQHRRLLGLGKNRVMTEAQQRHPHRSPEIIELQAEARLQTRLSAFGVLVPPNPDYATLVSNISAPILLVIAESGVVSPETARELRGLNPQLQIEQVPDAGHGFPFDRPGHLATVVRSFLHSVIAPIPGESVRP